MAATPNSNQAQSSPNSRVYSATEIAAMQRDAVNRVNEMRRIANEKLSMQYPSQPLNSNMNTVSNEPQYQPPAPPMMDEVASPSPPSFFPPTFSPEHSSINHANDNNTGNPLLGGLFSMFSKAGQSGSLTGIFDKLKLDSETVILIGMLLLLINEGADSMIILALVYILL